MNFYRYSAKIKDEWKNSGKNQKSIVERCAMCFEGYCDKSNVGFLVDNSNGLLGALAVRDPRNQVDENSFPWAHTFYEVDEVTFTEISAQEFADLMRQSKESGFLVNMSKVVEFLNDFSYGTDTNAGGILTDAGWYEEKMVYDSFTSEECAVRARGLFCEKLAYEIEKVASTKNDAFHFHPVHYAMRGANVEAAELLISALYENHRLLSKRYCVIDASKLCMSDVRQFRSAYVYHLGGTVVLLIKEKDAANREKMELIANYIMRYRKYTLTLVCFSGDCGVEDLESTELLSNVTFVDFNEDGADCSCARTYLERKAQEDGFEAPQGLFERLQEEVKYDASQLDELYDKWLQEESDKNLYPAYAELKKEKKPSVKIKGASFRQLMNMIGLTRAKQVIRKILAFCKAREMYGDRGFSGKGFSMHMCFTGNPGVAKTTVARLFAGIMKENGLLESGQFVEVGRADVVGQFVGHTAPKVKAAFEKAKGGVLFIDEAYSLVDDKDGSFGDEAIATIVQEMENNREDTCVIFAGYPERMEEFLKKNPGLRSRIAFHVPFDDYSVEELIEIAELMARENGVSFSEASIERISSIFEKERKSADFGNGRAVRNMLEKARLNQAMRLLQMDVCDVTRKTVTTILPEDIEQPEEKSESKYKLGFAA